MPPASPVPGWSSGEVCTLTIATRRGRPDAHLRQGHPLASGPHLGRQPVINAAAILPDSRSAIRGLISPPRVPRFGLGDLGLGAPEGWQDGGHDTRDRSRDRGQQRHRRGDRTSARQRGIHRRRGGPPARPAGQARGRHRRPRGHARRHVRRRRSPRSPPRSTECQVLVNNAGGAWGLDPVASSSVEDWRQMYDVNVLGAVR